MSKIIAEMATDSIDLGLSMILVLCFSAAFIAWEVSTNVWIVLVAIFLTQHVCRAIGRACVNIERDKTARIHGGGWGG